MSANREENIGFLVISWEESESQSQSQKNRQNYATKLTETSKNKRILSSNHCFFSFLVASSGSKTAKEDMVRDFFYFKSFEFRLHIWLL